MRQASWNEMFAPRHEPFVPSPEMPEEPAGWRAVVWWEHLLTFALLAVVLLSVIASVDRARWVDDMPSLYPIAFFGLVMGAVLARLRWPEGLVHILALPVGAAAVLGQILAILPGPSPWARFEVLEQRMGDWFGAAANGGISNDSLPFIVLVVAMSWLAAYFSSWAVFRWQNVWLALIPAGTALLMNISYLPGQFSFAFVFFLMGGTLLVTRLHLMERAKAWRRERTSYPTFLSLSVLHATFWVALLLLGLAWLLPQANQADALESLWRRATAPVTERVDGLSRLFISVNVKKGFSVHRFEDILPFLGSIDLPDTLAAEVTTEALEQPRYLRAQVYEIYTPTGWRKRSQQSSSLDANQGTQVDNELKLREQITIRVRSTGRTGSTVLSIGQPLRIDRAVELEWTSVPEDVTTAKAEGGLGHGAKYDTVGSISVASEEDLRAAGAYYPPWVRSLYLVLPHDFPMSVSRLAEQLADSQTTPYDQALAIESYLRTIPSTFDVPDTPVGRDAMDFFLFEAKRGYFDYHASAMVVMLRSVGIPARLAVGYVLQESPSDSGVVRYRLTEESAFAWPEVYFPGLGWVEFNPTPSLPTVRRPGEVVESYRPVPDGIEPSTGLGLENLLRLFPQGDGSAAQGFQSASSSSRNQWVLIGIAAGLAAVAVFSAGGLRYAWVRGLSGLEPPERLWGQTVRLASWARMAPDPSQTPKEYARHLRGEVPGLEGADLLAESFVQHRFGRRQADEEERARLEETWQTVRASLLRRLFRLRQPDDRTT